MEKLTELEHNLNIDFEDKDLLRQALCHRSYLNEHPDFDLSHNERLEFLGDAVLELAVTEHLFSAYPDKPEGELTSWRAALVNTEMLAQVAQELGVGDFLLLSSGEAKEGGKARRLIMANTMEALIGAVYLDQGMEGTRSLVEKYIIRKLPKVIEQGLYRDAKSVFQEVAQERESITPTYEVLEEWGPDHDKRFRVGVYLGEREVARGEGTSKQEAEEAAANAALELHQPAGTI